ncbi:MAG: D-2-hydroxyacid dehydrogenase [Muribaculaceae bacterium]|nr:D-2-hydroxyacid dehydrogenase [Muribaculaceae bacterium]
MKIVILDGYGLNPGDLSWQEFEKMGEVTVYDRTSPSEVHDRAKNADVILTNKVVLNKETIDGLPSLKYIGVLATGYNVVDIEAAHSRGITVTNIPAYSTMSVVQQVFALLLAVTNRPEHYALETRAGEWSRSKDFCYWNTPLIELAGKNFGIVGLGNIGMAVAKVALAFGMKVLAFTSKEIEDLPDGIEKVTLSGLFSSSDIISLHCPLTAQTDQLINAESISEMKTGVILINTGRGPLVDEKAVAEALKSGKIRAFCADVLSTEPPAGDNPLLAAPNTYITPHIAWATKEARERLMKIAGSNLKSFLSGKPVNAV